MQKTRMKHVGLYGLLLVAAVLLLAFAIHSSPNHEGHEKARQAKTGSLLSATASSQSGMDSTHQAATSKQEVRAKVRSKLMKSRQESDRGLVRESDADYVMDAVAIMDLCSDPTLKKHLSVDQMIAYEKLTHGVDSPVATTTEKTLAILCGKDWKIPPFDPQAIEATDPWQFFANNSRPFQDAIVFIDLLQSGDGADVPDKERSDFVVEKIKSADGLHELLETLDLFADAGVLAPALRGYGYPQDLLRGEGREGAAPYIIAACRIFNICDPYSPFAASLCFLLCDHPMSAPDYARSLVPEATREQVEQAADAIVAARFN